MRTTIDPDPAIAGHRTCKGSELQALTQQGWTLVFIAEETFRSRDVEVGGYAMQGNHNDGPPPVLERPVFVLARHRDAEIEALREQLHDARKVGQSASDAKAKAEEELKELATYKATASDLTNKLAAARRGEAEELARRRRLETDLAKVRTEVGEKEWKRITSG